MVLTIFDHAGSFKNQKNAFLNDPKSQNRGFWLFGSFKNDFSWFLNDPACAIWLTNC